MARAAPHAGFCGLLSEVGAADTTLESTGKLKKTSKVLMAAGVCSVELLLRALNCSFQVTAK